MIEWEKCPCGHPACDRWQPKNVGTFHQGCGFSTAERDWLDWAVSHAPQVARVKRVTTLERDSAELQCSANIAALTVAQWHSDYISHRRKRARSLGWDPAKCMAGARVWVGERAYCRKHAAEALLRVALGEDQDG